MIAFLIRDFAVTQERKWNPGLTAAPLILIESGKYRPRVVAADAAARLQGVKSGLVAGQARALCPQAQFLPVDEQRFRRMFLDLTQKLLEISPRIEPEYQPTSAVWYSDDLAARAYLADAIRQESGIAVQIGSAATRFPARVAAGCAAPEVHLDVPAGQEADFLAPYPVALLPLDAHMKRRLPLLGIDTLGQLAALPRTAVWEQFGKHGRWLHDLAQGKDLRPLSPYRTAPHWQQIYQFDDPLEQRPALYRVLERSSQAFIAAHPGQEARQVSLLLTQENGALLEQHRQPLQAVRDSLYLLRLLTGMLDTLPVSCGVTYLQVRLGEIRERPAVQLALFEERKVIQSIEQFAPEWARRHRAAAFYRLSLTGDEHLPERQLERLRVSGA
jgi:DNA polymerase-4